MFFAFALKRFPFNSDHPIGYLGAIILEYILCGYEYFVVACTLALGIGSYWLEVSATKIIQRILHTINNKARANKNQLNELKILFKEYIDTHAIVKQLSTYYNLLKVEKIIKFWNMKLVITTHVLNAECVYTFTSN